MLRRPYERKNVVPAPNQSEADTLIQELLAGDLDGNVLTIGATTNIDYSRKDSLKRAKRVRLAWVLGLINKGVLNSEHDFAKLQERLSQANGH